jgi:hypothetical protein
MPNIVHTSVTMLPFSVRLVGDSFTSVKVTEKPAVMELPAESHTVMVFPEVVMLLS